MKTHRPTYRVWPIFLGVLLLVDQGVAHPPVETRLVLGTGPLSLQISADHLDLQQHAKRLQLRGHVRVGAGKLDVRARRLVVLLSKKGTPRRLEATGNVRLRVDTSRGTAKQVTLRLDSRGRRTLELVGAASLTLERGLRVKGARIAVELDTGRLQVARPRITMNVPGGGDG